LLIGQTTPSLGAFASNDLPDLTRVEALRGGPSRVVVADVIDRDGVAAPRVFVVTFDTRFIYVYNPATHEIETRIHTGRGPHGFAVDSAHGLGYVGHFTDSYIGVVDLDQRHASYGQIILTLGEPTPPRASE
jgi:DNA-binding beta-propeller fold protein YncE